MKPFSEESGWIFLNGQLWASAGYRTALAFNKILCQALAGTHMQDASGWGVIISHNPLTLFNIKELFLWVENIEIYTPKSKLSPNMLCESRNQRLSDAGTTLLAPRYRATFSLKNM